jgi:phospholipase D1/2
VLATLTRQILPFLALELVWHRRIRFRLDSDHPVGACHHQKVIVVDDALAFCGGVDMTDDRWDTRAHCEGDPCRVRPDGSPYPPFHDATVAVAVAVDGAAARALGELARQRWYCGTGERLAPSPPGSDSWPERLRPSLRGVDVALARTHPRRSGRPPVHEIAHLYEDALRAATRTIYCESQYLASASLGDILAARLQEEGGPEVVIVNPRRAAGWLEEEAMDSARALVVDRLRRADRHRRFRIYQPVNAAETPIYVHAKILVIDDRLLRVGSSNLNNRSLGFDTECDVAIEAEPGEAGAATRATIVGFRDSVVAEHLDVAPAALSTAVARDGSLRAAIESLRRPSGKTLMPLSVDPPNDAERLLATSRLVDPERPGQAERRLGHMLKRLVLAPRQALGDAPRRALGDAPQAARDALADYRARKRQRAGGTDPHATDCPR